MRDVSTPASPPIRLLARVPTTNCLADPIAMLRIAEAAEELGFWGISVQDHLLADRSVSTCGRVGEHPGEDRVVYEALEVLTFLAARTERVRLITGVLVLPMREPIMLAKQLATLDVLSGGRLLVGVGLGAPVRAGRSVDGRQSLSAHGRISQREFEALGVRGDRGRMTDEAIQVMERLWTEDSASFDGRHFSFSGLDLYPKPLQKPRPPIWVGGRSPNAQIRAATLADGWFPSQISAGDFAVGAENISRLAAEAGRPAPEFGVNLFVVVAPTAERARELGDVALRERFTSQKGFEELTFVGSPEDVIARIEEYRRAGVTIFDLKFVPHELGPTLEMMRLIARDVAPAVGAIPAPEQGATPAATPVAQGSAG